jgi:hypothetical protein
MSKQSEAKAAQGYMPNPMACANCMHLKFEMELPRWMQEENLQSPGRYGDGQALQKNLRCGLGGFAVKKMGTCNKWEAKP